MIIDELPAKKITEKNAGKMICYDAGYEPESYAIAVKKDNEAVSYTHLDVYKRQCETTSPRGKGRKMHI